MINSSAIHIRNLVKTYGDVTAVDHISFEVFPGEIFGIVGPNGAGKTTTVECLEGLRAPDSGELHVLGLQPQKERHSLSLRIGVQLQQAILAHQMKVWEALDLFSSFYPKSLAPERLLDQLDLTESRNKAFIKLSGGQKQRLFIALALINDPELVFLDELTTGLDPQGRHAMWDLVRDINHQGKTVLLTTHFMEEAELLCHRVAIMDHGKIIGLDTPENLIKSLDAENKVIFSYKKPWDNRALNGLPTVHKVETTTEKAVITGKGEKFVADVVNFLTENHVRFTDLRTEQPNLEDVFLKYTGTHIRD